ncbi:HAD family hydrolase [Paenibacillus frigoriresistens]|nr:HAD family hydrolase [Paenibacillus frigoriresistens]
METLVDMYALPHSSDYALWAFENSGVEENWANFNEFLKNYEEAKKTLEISLPEYKEYELFEILLAATHLNSSIIENERNRTARALYRNYWKCYTERCYVKDEVKEVLHILSKRYKMGVVSNFKVLDGIEELLRMHNLAQYFNFVVTSVKEGWRKPHENIYRSAISLTGYQPNEILFFGDDLENDYLVPKKIGLSAILLDRNNNYKSLDNATSFYNILDILDVR